MTVSLEPLSSLVRIYEMMNIPLTSASNKEILDNQRKLILQEQKRLLKAGEEFDKANGIKDKKEEVIEPVPHPSFEGIWDEDNIPI